MKKIHNILLASAAASMLLTGCAEDFDTSYAAGNKPESVAMADLTRGYEVLKNYTGMKLGANLTIADLKAANTSFSTVLANFNEVNVVDGFSHAAVVADDGTVQINFKDYGNGMKDEDIPFALDKFYRGKNSADKPGAGLGLYIVKYITNKMNGEVRLYNHVDGLEVVVELPQRSV
jgi:hypothetical protein